MAKAVRLGFLTHVEGQADLATLYRRLITQFVAAEELGFDSGWIAQHQISRTAAPGLGPAPRPSSSSPPSPSAPRASASAPR